jgi:hypothetical protein
MVHDSRWSGCHIVRIEPLRLLHLDAGDTHCARALEFYLTNRFFAQRTDFLLGSLQPLLQALSVEHVSAVAVESAHLVFHRVLLQAYNALISQLFRVLESLSV